MITRAEHGPIRSIILALAAALPLLAGVCSAGGPEIYAANCQVCHQPDGNGVPGMYPALADSIGRYVRLPQGREYLVHVVSFGLFGTVQVHGQFFFGTMQAWTQLSDRDIADVLNFVLTKFNSKLLPKDFKPFIAAEVHKYRARAVGPMDNYQARDTLLKALDSAGK